MGLAKAIIRVSNTDEPSRYTRLEVLADTGATFTLIPKVTLEQIRVQADNRFRLKLSDDRFIERGGCTVWIEVASKSYRVPLIVGEDGDTPVLGITNLEILGLEVDPVNRTLKPVDYLLLQS